MTTSAPAPGGDYDGFASEYAAYVAWRERGGLGSDPFGLLSPLLGLLGDIRGQRVLDAGCGEGYLARALASGGARVTGVDLSSRLIELARARDPAGAIDFRVADLSRPVPELAASFDAAGCYLVLSDVSDYRGFAATLAAVLKPGGRLVVALNNPYSSVVDRHVTDYFDAGATSRYRGLWDLGIRAWYHHRTMENYVDAFLTPGLRLTKLADIETLADTHGPGAYLPEGGRFPRFTLLAFAKP